MLTTPAGWAVEVVTQGVEPWFPVVRLVPHGPWLLASGAPRVLNSTPDEAVVSFDAMVLLTMSVSNASTREIPAPSHPATLLVMMLLVTSMWYQLVGVDGNVTTSEPFTFRKAMP